MKTFSIDDIRIPYEVEKREESAEYTEEEDRFLAYMLYKYWYGHWEFFRNEIKNSPIFVFNF